MADVRVISPHLINCFSSFGSKSQAIKANKSVVVIVGNGVPFRTSSGGNWADTTEGNLNPLRIGRTSRPASTKIEGFRKKLAT